MLRILFFIMGVPMMFMSFSQVRDAVPYAQSVNLLMDGKEIVLTQEEQAKLSEQVQALFDRSITVPALGVVTQEMYEQDIQEGVFVSLKFANVVHINDLPFDELVFKVNENYQGFNLVRGNDGKYEGRCLYVNLDEGVTTQVLFNQIMEIESVKQAQAENE